MSLADVFTESDGKMSAMRVNSFIALLCAIALSAYALYKGSSSDSLPLIASWLVAAFVPKSVQKFAESKSP